MGILSSHTRTGTGLLGGLLGGGCWGGDGSTPTLGHRLAPARMAGAVRSLNTEELPRCRRSLSL